MPEVSSDEPQAENLIFPSKLRKPQAHSHSCRACLLNCVLFNFLCYSPKFPHRGLQKSFSVFPQGGGEAVFPFFFPTSFLAWHNQGCAQKGDKWLGISCDFLNSPVGAREVGVHAADRRCPETAAVLWMRWLFSETVRLWATGLQMKRRGGGMQPLQIQGLRCLAGHVCCCGEAEGKKTAVDKQTKSCR